MNSRKSWLVVAAVLASAILVGFYANGSPTLANDEPSATVNTCESLPDYDFERMVSRVEQIKGMQLQRNVSICTEQTANGIDTTPNGRRFVSVREPGLSFFELDAQTETGRRNSIGHTSIPLGRGPIEITLANKSTVENVSYTSYEAVIAHEISHAIDDSHLRLNATDSRTRTEVRQTTDWTLANRAIREGSAMYVAELYVREHGGEQTVSKLGEETRSWKHQTLISVYSEGYHYSKNADVTSPNQHRANSTAAILHPERSEDPGTFPTRPNLSMDSLEHERTDRVGELFLRETLASKGVSSERAAAAADGWANDRMDYYRGNDSTVVTWRVTWQNADEKTEFVETYDEVYDYERVDAIRSVDCQKPGRYLTTSEEAVTVVQCSGGR